MSGTKTLANSMRRQPRNTRFRKRREGKVRPIRGNVRHGRIFKWAGFATRKRAFVAIAYAPLRNRIGKPHGHTRVAFFKAGRNLSIRCGAVLRPKPGLAPVAPRSPHRLANFRRAIARPHGWRGLTSTRRRGPRLNSIATIDGATSRVMARLAESDSMEANRGVLEFRLRWCGRTIGCYSGKASLLQTALKTKRGRQKEGKDREPAPPAQIACAPQERNIERIAAHSPQANGRIGRFWETAQGRPMRRVKAPTMEQANEYVDHEFLPGWPRKLAAEAATSGDAHRKLGKERDPAAILSHVEKREVADGYTVRLDTKIYGSEHADVCKCAFNCCANGLPGATVRVEKRRHGTVAIRFRDRYLRNELCKPAKRAVKPAAHARSRKGPNAGGKSKWMKNFVQTKGPSIGKAIAISNATS